MHVLTVQGIHNIFTGSQSMRSSFLLAASVVALLPFAAAATAISPKATLGTFGIDTSQMDRSIKPGDDFYRYVNGKWLATTTIPADKSRYGSFDVLRDKSETDLHVLLSELIESPPTDPTLKKVVNLYLSWMDEAAIEKRGITPLQPDLDRIAAAKNKTDLMRLIGSPQMSAPFGFGIQPDPADTSRYKVFIGQAGLGMGRDYYINEGAEYDTFRSAYQNYIATLLRLTGDTDSRNSAKAVFALEMSLAQVQWTPARQRDVQATYNPMSRGELMQLAPNVDWPVVFEASGLGDTQHVVVGETSAISDGAALLDSVPLDTWKQYLTFHRASDTANLLPKDFDDANFDFNSRTMRGVQEQRDRWKRGVTLVDNNLGEGLGKAYVEKHFPPEHKAQMEQLVNNLLAALKARIDALDWMDNATRVEALKKLATFDPRIGYPSTWRDYSRLAVEPGTLFENVQNADRFEWERRVSRLNQPVDRNEWHMTPPTVNAYYSPLMNQITFPAAILQPPFFDGKADPAVNYGGIGAVIGHEIGHGFDDQGRQFDENGRIRNWWTPATVKRFTAATKQLSEQYSAYCPIPGDDKTCVNGALTLGENIGDLGGMQMAYTAYRLSLQGREAPVIEGFTGDQRFFMAWAQVWRGKSRDDALLNLLLTNPHAPQMVRGQNPQRNIDEWYEAFSVTKDDAMYLPPESRVRIW
tara:strand:- start:20407 stop:22494 length:2088 start_codon:yes stop_codon:yes gene_type:complete